MKITKSELLAMISYCKKQATDSEIQIFEFVDVYDGVEPAVADGNIDATIAKLEALEEAALLLQNDELYHLVDDYMHTTIIGPLKRQLINNKEL